MKFPFRASDIVLPLPVRSNVPNTWAYDTMTRRVLEDAIPRTASDNQEKFAKYPEIEKEFRELESSLLQGKDGYLTDIDATSFDSEDWSSILSKIPKEDRNWIDAPWLIAEFYMFRRIIQAFDFFETHIDPFQKQKVMGLSDSLPAIRTIFERLPTPDKSRLSLPEIIQLGIFTSLWGNKLDLSLWPKQQKQQASTSEASSDSHSSHVAGTITTSEQFHLIREYILDDQVEEVVHYLQGLRAAEKEKKTIIVDIVVDNAGFELVSDFILAHLLLSFQVADKIRFHTKLYPTFVSDATTNDCMYTIHSLNAPFQKIFLDYVENKQFEFIEDKFWCEPIAFWDMPDRIYERIQDSSLVFIKGDANYRRLLEDRHWPYDFSAKQLLSYWPVPVCALRTLKAEVACGISPENQERARKADSKWLVSGRWAVVQYYNPSR
jgi:hypothetical protein